MRTKKWKALIVAALSVVILTAAVGGTMAWLSTHTGSLTNTFEPAKVTCEVDETFTDKVSTEKKDVRIQNTGDTDAYIRAMIVANWCTADNKVVATAKPIYEGLSSNGWVQGSDGFYYYTKPVASQDFTDYLFTSCKPDDDEKPEGADHLEVNIICQAIQSTPASAVGQAWGVSISEGSVTTYPSGN